VRLFSRFVIQAWQLDAVVTRPSSSRARMLDVKVVFESFLCHGEKPTIEFNTRRRQKKQGHRSANRLPQRHRRRLLFSRSAYFQDFIVTMARPDSTAACAYLTSPVHL
jgi:hypothetical protein